MRMIRLLAASLAASIVAGGLVPVARAVPARTLSLDGTWNFAMDPGGSLKVTDLATLRSVRPIVVPGSWQAQFDDLRDYAGIAWYWRRFNLGDVPSPDVVLLRFGAVDYRADLYVNGEKVGSHEGGYLPFACDITRVARVGENEVAVRVADPGAKPDVVEGIRYAEIPHGKQSWYVQTSGLWQPVEVEIRPRLHVQTTHVSAGADGAFRIELALANATVTGQARAEMFDPEQRSVWQGAVSLQPGQDHYSLAGKLAHPDLWNLELPRLYTLRVSLSSGDTYETRFGFRTFQARGGKFYLNGQVVYLRGALDQAFYPESEYTPPSADYLRQEMRQAKALGLNLLRCHIKVPDPRYLDAADEAGLLVWYEIPNWDRLTADSKRRGMETLRGMAERDWNHPSIVIASIINESWGIDLKEADQRAWLKQAYAEAKRIVPGWLVDDNSACCQNFHMATDIADFHQYNAIPDYAGDFDRFVADLATRPRWLFSPEGDAAPKGSEPLVLSEFGNWGLPHLPATLPWWFGRDFEGRKITLPAGVGERFTAYHYGSIFRDFAELAEATQWHEFDSLKYEIEALRARPEIQGYVITEFTDVHWESNGLLDMWRHPKVFAGALSKLQQDDAVILRCDTRNLYVGGQAQAEVYFSHYAPGMRAAQLAWELEGTALSGSFDVPAMPPGTVAKIGRIRFAAPAVTAPARRVLRARLARDGRTVAEDSLDLFIYPAKKPELVAAVAFHDPPGKLRRLVNEMRARNYLPPSGTEALPVTIASTLDGTVRQTLRSGGRVILLAHDREDLAPGLRVVPRAGSTLDGNWISSFLWVRKDQEPFKAIGFAALPGFEAQVVAPPAVVEGVPPEHFDNVLSGMFYGWIHSNVGTLVQAAAGKGLLLICTFRVAESYGSDPYATYLLDALVDYARSGVVPRFQIPI
jgi:hypothetical protein